jgi:hypothetical protein
MSVIGLPTAFLIDPEGEIKYMLYLKGIQNGMMNQFGIFCFLKFPVIRKLQRIAT